MIRYEPSPYRNASSAENTYYVASVDYAKEIVSALSFSGNSCQIRFEEISDIIKATNPIMVFVPQKVWLQHNCDPEWRGKPVRAQAMMVFQGRITGVTVPKWPGKDKGVISWTARAGDASLPDITDADLVRSLPGAGFNVKRYGDGAAARNRDYRVAGNRVAKFFLSVMSSGKNVNPPLDPSYSKSL